MKIFIKTLKGTHFDIEVKPEDAVGDVKKKIETVQGAELYPAAQQMLIHKGKVLKDETTLSENSVAENSFIVIMLAKNKGSSADGAAGSTAPTTKTPQASVPPVAPAPASTAPLATSAMATPAPVAEFSPVASTPIELESDVYGQAASNLVAGSNSEGAVQQILDMGGGTWDRDTVVHALRAAFNNPERAVEYLYSGIAEQPEAPAVARAPVAGQTANPASQSQQLPQPAAVPTSGPNANPLDLFPQGLPNIGAAGAGAGTLDLLRNSQQFQALRAMVQAKPTIIAAYASRVGETESSSSETYSRASG